MAWLRDSRVSQGPGQPSRWYKAFLSACKAAEAALAANTEEGAPYTYFFLSKPVVILDGPLVVADLSDSGEITLAETEAAHFQFGFSTPKYKQARYSVDLVRLGALPWYLELSARRLDTIFRTLAAAPKRNAPAA